MITLAEVIALFVLGYVAVRAARWADIDVRPAMTLLAIVFIVMGATLLLIEVRNGSADGNLVLGAIFMAVGVMKFVRRTA